MFLLGEEKINKRDLRDKEPTVSILPPTVGYMGNQTHVERKLPG